MREQSPLFARFRLMIARLMERGDIPPFGEAAGPYSGVRVPRPGGRPLRSAGAELEEPRAESEAPDAVAVARPGTR